MIGRVISDRYVVQGNCGSGGMATVYRAYDQITKREVAIKMLHREMLQVPNMEEQFRTEANAVLMVSHQCIVQIQDVGTFEGIPYIVMEYVNGITLKEKIRQETYLTCDQALIYAIRILSAVSKAHEQGIIHRDIKPQNILISKGDQIKVADFGIARIRDKRKRATSESDEPLMGSPHYLSPEQLDGKEADTRSDLYSVGVVLYEMLTGKLPYVGHSINDLRYKQKHEKPKRPGRVRNGVSRSMDEVVMKALETDPEKRYQTAKEMATDLRRITAQPNGGIVHREHDPVRVRTTIAILAVIAVLVCGLGILAVYMEDVGSHVIMPNVLGLPGADTVQKLEEMGLICTTSEHYSEEYVQGRIAGQSVESGRRIEKGTRIELIISEGPEWYELGDYSGMTENEVRAELSDPEKYNIRFEYVRSDVPVGHVVSQSTEAGPHSREEGVVLYVSADPVKMPSLAGLTLNGAKCLLEAEGLHVGNIRESVSEDALADTVIRQSIEAGTITEPGTAVDLVVSQMRQAKYNPDTAFTIAVPVDNAGVYVLVESPTQTMKIAYEGTLDAGTYRIELTDDQPGEHIVRVYINEVLMETVKQVFK